MVVPRETSVAEADWWQDDGDATSTMTVAVVTVIARRRGYVIGGCTVVVMADAWPVMAVPTILAIVIVVMATKVLVMTVMPITAVCAPIVAVGHRGTAESQGERCKYRTESFHGLDS